MSIKAAIRIKLLATANVTGRTGSRIYPVGASPSKRIYPYITYFRVSAVHERHLGGGAELAHPRFQINVWSLSADEAELLADAIRESMDNFSGRIETSNATVDIRASFLESDEDDFEQPRDATNRGVHSRKLDFVIWHKETATPV